MHTPFMIEHKKIKVDCPFYVSVDRTDRICHYCTNPCIAKKLISTDDAMLSGCNGGLTEDGSCAIICGEVREKIKVKRKPRNQSTIIKDGLAIKTLIQHLEGERTIDLARQHKKHANAMTSAWRRVLREYTDIYFQNLCDIKKWHRKETIKQLSQL